LSKPTGISTSSITGVRSITGFARSPESLDDPADVLVEGASAGCPVVELVEPLDLDRLDQRVRVRAR
jgi:hypothetical protein